MALLTLASGFALLIANLWLYRRQRIRFPAMNDAEREPYEISVPTRAFRMMKGPLYGVVLLHLMLEATLLHPEGPSVVRFALGSGAGAVGLVLVAVSLDALGANFAPCDRGASPFERVSSGPYRYVAHPLYAGNLLVLLGIGIMSFGWLIAVCWIFLAVVYAFAVRDEERAFC